MTKIEYRPDGRQKVTQPNQPKPLSHAEVALERRRASDHTRLILQPHRISWAYHNGPIPAGALVLHRCDNRVCCNPAHLFLGTHKQNTQDAITKGRFAPGPFPHGDKHYNTKIPDSEIQVIRDARAAGVSQRKLGRKYGVSKTQIRRIERGESRV